MVSHTRADFPPPPKGRGFQSVNFDDEQSAWRLEAFGCRDSGKTIMEKLMYPFMTRVLLPEEGGGYLIEFPDLPGCMSDGETLEDAIENGKDALQCWIEAAAENGQEIPEPGSSPTWVQ